MGSPATSGYRRSGDLPVPGREWLADPVAVSPRCSRAWWRSCLLVGPGSGGGQPQVLSRMVALLPAGGSGFGVAVSPRCSRAWWRSFLLVGPGSGWRSAPGALAHGGAPSCCVPVARYIDRLYTTDLRLTCPWRQSV